MLPRNHPGRMQIAFDDHRLVANAGLLLPAILAQHLGLRELVDHHLDLGGVPGRANTGDKPHPKDEDPQQFCWDYHQGRLLAWSVAGNDPYPCAVHRWIRVKSAAVERKKRRHRPLPGVPGRSHRNHVLACQHHGG